MPPALSPSPGSSDASSSARADHVAKRLFGLSIGVFFLGGFLTSIVGLLVPRLTITLGLDYTRALLVQFAFHLSYLLFALPIAAVIVRRGYMRSITIGLSVMTLGCLALVAATTARSFGLTLLALLTLSTGITFLQIASNTVVTVVGPSRHAAARLTLLQAFNALGTGLGPPIGAVFLLGAIGVATAGLGTGAEATPFVAGAIGLAALALAFRRDRDLLGPAPRTRLAIWRDLPRVAANRRLLAGTAAIFAYVGAEVTIGTLIPNFLMQPDILAARPVAAGQFAGLYWTGAMAGRFAGAVLLRRFAAQRLLACAAIGGFVLTLLASGSHGAFAAATLIAVGLCNAIMYPTIYALALPADARDAPLASMLLCMAVVGGAIVPLATGILADHFGLAAALVLPACCYLVIVAFTRACRAGVRSVNT